MVLGDLPAYFGEQILVWLLSQLLGQVITSQEPTE